MSVTKNILRGLLLATGLLGPASSEVIAGSLCLDESGEEVVLGIDRQAAELIAWELVRSSTEDVESPLSIVCSLGETASDCSDPEGLAHAKRRLEDFLQGESLSCLNEPGAELVPEHGESLDSNWVFSLYLRTLSDHIYFAVVPKDGLSQAYIYGFN